MGDFFIFVPMAVVLFDHPEIRESLLPLTYTRPVGDLRIGILTLAEKWASDLQSTIDFLTVDYLMPKFGASDYQKGFFINGAICPDEDFIASVQALEEGHALWSQGVLLAAHTQADSLTQLLKGDYHKVQYQQPLNILRQTWELFLHNGSQIEQDFKRITSGRKSAGIDDPHTVVYNPEQVFVEPNVQIKAAIINAEQGPVYLGADCEVQEGTIIQGPFALCAHSQLRLGGKMRPNTTIGPYCKIGGEVGNVIFHSYSNKAHEGFLGNSVIGSWCNMGADTNNSNLKNNYSPVKVWDYMTRTNLDTGLQFCGTIMGDHSKCSINTMLNTGTVVGVCANIFGGGFPPKFVPSFSWGGIADQREYNFQKFCETAHTVMNRRGVPFDDIERTLMHRVFEDTSEFRQNFS